MPGYDQELTFKVRPGGYAPHRSFWMEQALAGQDAALPALAGDARYDVCIVGGGFTGLWTALRLRDRDAAIRIAIVEADLCGAGASGRNSGGMGHWWSKLPTLLRLFGDEDGAFVLRKSVEILDEIRSFVATNDVDCLLRREPSAWSTTTRAQKGAWPAVFAAADRLGIPHPYRVLDAAELRDRFGRGPYYSAVIDENGTRIQPALLARGLLRLAVARGIDVYENTPVTRIASRPQDVLVATPAGSIAAGNVVLAANAWMAHLPAFRAFTMVVSSEVIMTEPVGELLDARGLADKPGGVTSSQMLNYGGYTPDRRVYVGGAGGNIGYRARIGPEFDHSRPALDHVTRDFRYLYPELADVPVACGWSGPIDRSTTGLPVFSRLPDPRIHYAIGYTGHGVAASAIAGHALADAVLGRESDWSQVAHVLERGQRRIFPPEPIRYYAGRVVRASVARKERAERAGQQPNPVDRKLSTFANATWPRPAVPGNLFPLPGPTDPA